MSDDNKNKQDISKITDNDPKVPFFDFNFIIGVLSGLLVLILGIAIGNKLATTYYEIDVTHEGFKLALLFIASYIGSYAPIIGGVSIAFNFVGLKIKTKFLKILNYIIISIAFLEILLLFSI